MAVIPSEPSTAFWILSNTLCDLLSWAEHPDPQTLSGDWLQAYKDRIRSQSRSAIVSIESLGDAALAVKIKDAERLAVRFATLICDNPTLSTVPVQDWNVARFRELFDELGKSEELFKRLAKPEDTAAKTEAQPITGVTKPEAASTATPAKVKRGRTHNRKPAKGPPRQLTDRQSETLRLFGELNGNMSEVARRMGITHPVARQHYDAANKKLGITISERARTMRLAGDRLGQGVKGLPAQPRAKGVKVDD